MDPILDLRFRAAQAKDAVADLLVQRALKQNGHELKVAKRNLRHEYRLQLVSTGETVFPPWAPLLSHGGNHVSPMGPLLHRAASPAELALRGGAAPLRATDVGLSTWHRKEIRRYPA